MRLFAQQFDWPHDSALTIDYLVNALDTRERCFGLGHSLAGLNSRFGSPCTDAASLLGTLNRPSATLAGAISKLNWLLTPLVELLGVQFLAESPRPKRMNRPLGNKGSSVNI